MPQAAPTVAACGPPAGRHCLRRASGDDRL